MHRFNHLSRPTSGFTLLEVLVSLSILAVALVAVVGSTLSVQDAFSRGQTKERCAMLAQWKLRQVQFQGLDNLVATQGTFANAPGFTWRVQTRMTNVATLHTLVVQVWPDSASASAEAGVTLEEYAYAPPQ